MRELENERMRKWENEKMRKWENWKMREWENERMSRVVKFSLKNPPLAVQLQGEDFLMVND